MAPLASAVRRRAGAWEGTASSPRLQQVRGDTAGGRRPDENGACWPSPECGAPTSTCSGIEVRQRVLRRLNSPPDAPAERWSPAGQMPSRKQRECAPSHSTEPGTVDEAKRLADELLALFSERKRDGSVVETLAPKTSAVLQSPAQQLAPARRRSPVKLRMFAASGAARPASPPKPEAGRQTGVPSVRKGRPDTIKTPARTCAEKQIAGLHNKSTDGGAPKTLESTCRTSVRCEDSWTRVLRYETVISFACKWL